MSDNPAPLVGEPIGSAAVDQQGVPFATTFGQNVRAGLFGTSKEIGSLIERMTPYLGDELGQQLGSPEQQLNPEEAQKQFGAPGLKFSSPVYPSIAQAMQRDQLDANDRESVSARYEGGIMGRLGVGAVTSVLDPANLALGLVPGIGEARAAELLGLDLGTVAGRIGARAISGLTGGAAGAAPLEALGAITDPDWSAAQIPGDVLTQALLGGILHPLFGEGMDRLFHGSPDGQLAASDVDLDTAALRTAAAQILEGRNVEVRPIFDAARDEAGMEAATDHDPQAVFAEAQRAAASGMSAQDRGLMDAARDIPVSDPSTIATQVPDLHASMIAMADAGRLHPDEVTELAQIMENHTGNMAEVERMQATGECAV